MDAAQAGLYPGAMIAGKMLLAAALALILALAAGPGFSVAGINEASQTKLEPSTTTTKKTKGKK